MNAQLLPNSPGTLSEKQAKPMPGSGTRLTVNEMGYAHSAPRTGQTFRHPWRPSLGANTIKLSRGLVDTFEPMIKGKFMSGSAAYEQPALKLDPKQVNDKGESWIVLEVEPNEEGRIDAKSRIEIVQLAEVNLHQDKIGRQALVMVIFRKQSTIQAFEIAYFNLRYQRIIPAPGHGPAHHFFL